MCVFLGIVMLYGVSGFAFWRKEFDKQMRDRNYHFAFSGRGQSLLLFLALLCNRQSLCFAFFISLVFALLCFIFLSFSFRFSYRYSEAGTPGFLST